VPWLDVCHVPCVALWCAVLRCRVCVCVCLRERRGGQPTAFGPLPIASACHEMPQHPDCPRAVACVCVCVMACGAAQCYLITVGCTAYEAFKLRCWRHEHAPGGAQGAGPDAHGAAAATGGVQQSASACSDRGRASAGSQQQQQQQQQRSRGWWGRLLQRWQRRHARSTAACCRPPPLPYDRGWRSNWSEVLWPDTFLSSQRGDQVHAKRM
jgi:hypothetical protein